MMSTKDNVSVVPESPSSRRSRSSSSVSISSVSSKQGKNSIRKSSSLPSETVEYLKAWMMSPEHVAHPYPTEQEKAQIMEDTGIELKQLTNWFVNNRKRFWKPRVEARLQQQAQVQAAAAAAAAAAVAQVVNTNHQGTKGYESPNAQYIALDMTQPAPPRQRRVSTDDTHPSSPFGRSVSVVGSDDMSSFVPEVHTVSEASSSGSDSDSVSTSDDDVNSTSCEVDKHSGVVSRTEAIDVHILRPHGKQLPTIEDVSVSTNVPSGRILRTFKSCQFSYQFLNEIASDRKKVQGRRSAEVLRLKKRYLKVYLSEASQSTQGKRKRREEESPVERRSKYLRESPMLWREACHEASTCFDDALPSLEEAAHLFGFLKSLS